MFNTRSFNQKSTAVSVNHFQNVILRFMAENMFAPGANLIKYESIIRSVCIRGSVFQ